MLKGMLHHVLVWVIATLACVQTQKIDQEEIPSCQGVFDFYFVLDSSGSVDENFHSEVVPFVRNVSSFFVREAIEAGIRNLTEHSPGGSTNLAPGLSLVADQIETAGGDTAAVVLVLTDGEWQDVDTSQEQAQNLRRSGARLFGIGVGESVDEQQLLSIADETDQVFFDISFQQLDEVIEKVVNKTCIGITDVSPNQICLGSTDTVTLLGRGFTIDLNQSAVTCRFQMDNGHSLATYPTDPVKYSRVVCPAPQLNRTGNVLLQISLNGVSYISSNVTLALSACEAESKAYVAGIVLGLLALVTLLLLLLLWFFFPLITGKVVGGLPQEHKTKDVESNPPKKWEVVDASYYGGGGAGGIKPVTVRWGKSGATEEGSKLTRAKDATVVSVVRESGTSQRKDPTPTCWEVLKKKAKRMYAVLASYRPVRGPTRRIMWCPNYHAKYSVHSETSGTSMAMNPESPNSGRSGSIAMVRPKAQTITAPHVSPERNISKPRSATVSPRQPPLSQPQESMQTPFEEGDTHKVPPSRPPRPKAQTITAPHVSPERNISKPRSVTVSPRQPPLSQPQESMQTPFQEGVTHKVTPPRPPRPIPPRPKRIEASNPLAQ